MINLKYIQDNIKRLDEFALNKIESEIKRQHIQDLTGFYLSRTCNTYSIGNTKITVDIDNDIESILKEIKDKGAKACGTYEDFKEFYKFQYLFGIQYFQYKDNTFYIRDRSPNADTILSFLIYVSNNFEKNDQSNPGYDLGKKYGLLNKEVFDVEILELNVKIKKYKNGKIKIVFKDKEIQDRLIKETCKLQEFSNI